MDILNFDPNIFAKISEADRVQRECSSEASIAEITVPEQPSSRIMKAIYTVTRPFEPLQRDLPK